MDRQQKEKITLCSTFLSQKEQKAEAAVGTGLPKLYSWRVEKCILVCLIWNSDGVGKFLQHTLDQSIITLVTKNIVADHVHVVMATVDFQ